MEKHPLHLKIPDLQTSPEVESAILKHERLEDETLPNDPSARIEAYMDRLENIFLNTDERVRERNNEMLRDSIYDTFIIKPENVPESYFELQQQVARERGQAVETIPENVRRQMIDTAIEDQKHSLDNWIDYLTSSDAVYPTWFKYFVFRNITKLSQFDKDLGKFKTRTDSTVAPFPDIYREPLAQIADAYQKVAEDNKTLKDPEIKDLFSKKFPTLYAELIQKSLAASIENKEGTAGEWVKYFHDNEADAEKLYQSLEGKGTGWCTAGKSTAEAQINSGDFYVYYTYDKDQNPTQPRIAIRMEEDKIAEVRGILQHQSLEPQMNDILEAKLRSFGPEADKYKKKSADMRQLTDIEKKTKENISLSKTDLEFLYELNGQIAGFGYQKDPRVEEVRATRNPEQDMLAIFDCTKDQLAHTPREITPDTKAYLGPWNPTVLQTIKNYPNISHLYESFPDKKIFFQTLETDPAIQTPAQAEAKFKEKAIYLTDYGKDLLSKTEFSKTNESYQLVRFTVGELGFPSGATTDEIYAKAKTLGLDLCPAEVGPQLRLAYSGGEWMLIAMKQILDRSGDPDVFRLDSGGDGLELGALYADPDGRWGADSYFVFCLRK
ncbi:MAG: hypothetical protein WCO79_03245 [bacterium]